MDDIATPASMHAMPVEIIKAVIAVMRDVKKLGKDHENKFGKYKYVSVDQFYEALSPIMASHGLMNIVNETSTVVEVRETTDDYGKVKKGAWLIATYDIFLCHEGGAISAPIHRSIQVPATGAQSFASAQSYVEKYFLRTLFKVPTGEVYEVDASPPQSLPAPAPVQSVEKLDKTEVMMIETALKELDSDIRTRVLKREKVERIEDIRASSFPAISGFLNSELTKIKRAAE